MSDVETTIEPPTCDQDEDGGGGDGVRVSASMYGDERHMDTSIQMFGDEQTSPEAIADALLAVVLGLARAAGPDISWAVVERLARYDGTS